MDLSYFEALDSSDVHAQAAVMLAALGLARELRAHGSEVGTAVLDLAVSYPPVSLVAFDGTLGMVVGYRVQGSDPALCLGIPGGTCVAPAAEAALVAFWGDLSPERVARAYADGGTGVSAVVVHRTRPFSLVTSAEA